MHPSDAKVKIPSAADVSSRKTKLSQKVHHREVPACFTTRHQVAESCKQPSPSNHRTKQIQATKYIDQSSLPIDYKCAGVIPFNDDGFWLAEMKLGYSDFGGKREKESSTGLWEAPWSTARRELAEEGGITITACPEWTYHPESKAQNVVFYAETCEEPSPNEKVNIKSVKFVSWRVYTASGLPSELHPRIKFDKGSLIKKKLMELSKRVDMNTSKTPKRQRTNGEETITSHHNYVTASAGGDSGEGIGGMEDNMGMGRPATAEGDYAKEDLCGETGSDVGYSK